MSVFCQIVFFVIFEIMLNLLVFVIFLCNPIKEEEMYVNNIQIVAKAN